jgi:hypothetical protein
LFICRYVQHGSRHSGWISLPGRDRWTSCMKVFHGLIKSNNLPLRGECGFQTLPRLSASMVYSCQEHLREYSSGVESVDTDRWLVRRDLLLGTTEVSRTIAGDLVIWVHFRQGISISNRHDRHPLRSLPVGFSATMWLLCYNVTRCPVTQLQRGSKGRIRTCRGLYACIYRLVYPI